MTVYDGDPEQGGKPLKYTESTAFYEGMIKPYNEYLERIGEPTPIPTHNYELLKEHRKNKYNQDLKEFLAERLNNEFRDNPVDVVRFRLLWLQDELARNVENWLSPNRSNGKPKRIYRTSDVIEQQKYKDYVLDEIKTTEEKIQRLTNAFINKSTNSKRQGKSSNQDPQPLGFDSYIDVKYRAKLLSHLVDTYNYEEPRPYGFMLYALANLRCISPATLNGNQSALHRALQITFGNVGTRAGLNTAIRRLDPKEINDEDKRHVESHIQQIKAFLDTVDIN